MSDESEQSENDGLDALASGLTANEGPDADADEELDLASLAAVVGARSTLAGEDAPVPPSAPPPPAPAAVAAAAPARAWLVPTLVVFAVGVGAAGYLLGRSSRPEERAAVSPPVPSASPAQPAPAAPPGIAEPPARSQPVASAPSQPSLAAPEAPTARVARPAPRAGEPTAKPAPGVASAPDESAPTTVAPEPETPAKPADPSALAKAGSATSRSVDELLDEALAGPAERRATQTAEASVLPEAPSRDEVTQAMAVLLPAIRGCAMGQAGLATAGIVVRGDGRVASVELTGPPFEGTASGRCMEGVLRRARFARFRQPTFRVRFPFSIQ